MGPTLGAWGDRIYINYLFKQGHAKVWFEANKEGMACCRVKSKWHTEREIEELRALAERHVKALLDTNHTPSMNDVRKLALGVSNE